MTFRRLVLYAGWKYESTLVPSCGRGPEVQPPGGWRGCEGAHRGLLMLSGKSHQNDHHLNETMHYKRSFVLHTCATKDLAQKLIENKDPTEIYIGKIAPIGLNPIRFGSIQGCRVASGLPAFRCAISFVRNGVAWRRMR